MLVDSKVSGELLDHWSSGVSFLSLHTFVRDLFTDVYGRIFLFGIQLDKDELYRDMELVFFWLFSHAFVIFFLSLHASSILIFVADFSAAGRGRNLLLKFMK